MDINQNFENPEDLDSLREENSELKKELEREQLLHKMLYKEWKELNEQVPPKQYEVPDERPRNLFYKYAFYVLLIALIPAFYFWYSGTGNEKKVSSSQAVVDPSPGNDTTSPVGSGSGRDDVPKNDSQTTTTTSDQSINDDILHQPAIRPESNVPETKPAEKKVVSSDAGKQAITTPKPIIEGPLTDDARDSIYWIGFNAYFDHHPNHFNKSSARYKAWMDGWNDAKIEGKKVVTKDSEQKQK